MLFHFLPKYLSISQKNKIWNFVFAVHNLDIGYLRVGELHYRILSCYSLFLGKCVTNIILLVFLFHFYRFANNFFAPPTNFPRPLYFFRSFNALHSNALKPPKTATQHKTATPIQNCHAHIFRNALIFYHNLISCVNVYTFAKKLIATPTLIA